MTPEKRRYLRLHRWLSFAVMFCLCGACSKHYPLIAPHDAALLPPLEIIQASWSVQQAGTLKDSIARHSRHPKVLLNWVSTVMSDTWFGKALLQVHDEVLPDWPSRLKFAIYQLPQDEYLRPVNTAYPRSMIGFALIHLFNDTDNDGEIDNLVAPSTVTAFDSINNYPYLRTPDKDWLFGASFHHFFIYCTDDRAVAYFRDTMAVRAGIVIRDELPDGSFQIAVKPGYNILRADTIHRVENADITVSWRYRPDPNPHIEIVESFSEYNDSLPTVKGVLPAWLSMLEMH